ncbi:hypothetical protein K2173_017756 [Erythroxylum novogranatense]|uniref:Protein kinase domain-containing protein n=1 Tax=Erythroxylum novogranatense TaxID=1862640 RepID=A0AAV8SLR0_9ROSI|nr:hypothetical protein K2173_017756 [Erythroxylum novogranatense]
MAFDQNSVPKDPRPLNVALRGLAEEQRIEAATNTSAATSVSNTATPQSPEFFINPEGSIPVFYPAPVSDAGFVGFGYGNLAPGVARWGSVLPVPAGNVNVGVNPRAVGFGYSANIGHRLVGNAVDLSSKISDMTAGLASNSNMANRVNANGSNELKSSGFDSSSSLGNRGSGSGADHGSEDGGDDSVSGKKVKFLCSFGGKILPRPSDGALRYVGGQTRIISVRRDVSFHELMQKMIETYGQPVVIKYQLPDEDLDSLVSVSCADDLDNMMDEYEKLAEKSSDGSAKLRVFLFSPTDLDISGMLQLDLHDNGQRYVDAVNGILDTGGGSGGGIARKESIASATSTQNSDFSGTEAIDSSGAGGLGDVNGPPSTSLLSPRGNSGTSHDSSTKLAPADPGPAVYADASAVSLGIPVVKSGPHQILPSQPEVELERSAPVSLPQQQMGYDNHQLGMTIPAPAPHLPAYTNHHLPPHMGFPNAHLLGNTASIYNQQQLCTSNTGLTPCQVVPAAHVAVTPLSSHVAMRPNLVQPLMQPPATRLEHFIQLPIDPSYKMYQAVNPPATAGGAYGWRPVPQPEHVPLSDASVPHQQVIFHEKPARLEDCYLCQKALPHAHSDPLVQDQRESSVSPLSDSHPVHYSLLPEDTMKGRPRVVTSGALGDIEHGSGPQITSGAHVDHQIQLPRYESNFLSDAFPGNERSTVQKVENYNHPNISVPSDMMTLPADSHTPYGMFTSTIPYSQQDDLRQQLPVPTQYHIKQEASLNQNINCNIPNSAGQPVQASELLFHESPVQYTDNLPPLASKDDEQLKSIDRMMESLRVYPSEVNPIDQIQSTVGKKDILDHVTQQIAGREVLLDSAFNRHQVALDPNHVKQTEVLPSSTEASYLLSSHPLPQGEVTNPPNLGNPGLYLQSKIGVLDPINPALSAAEPAYVVDRTGHSGSKNDTSLMQPKIVPNNMEAVGANNASSLLPLCAAKDVQDSSNSLFSNQDPWNCRHDTNFPPPRPSKVSTRKDAFGNRDPFNTNHLGNTGEFIADIAGCEVSQPFSYSSNDLGLEHTQSSKGSADEQIKQELRIVAEGVADSVFQSIHPSSDSTGNQINESLCEVDQRKDISNKEVEMQHKAKLEEMKVKLPEKLNLGFPVSQGIGRLQIIKNSDLEELRELGSGTFGTVYHGKWRGTDVAIKRINDRCFTGKPSEQERMVDDFWNEAIKLADLHHPNVVAFYGVVLDGPGGSVATVTEFMVNGSLRTALQKNERSLDKRKRLLIAMDVAFGMEYLHGKNIVHFDLKSDNLLVNLRDPHRPICKVGDLGLSKVKCQTLISGGVRGTLPWMAPELLNGSSSLVSEKVDVFSFGIVLWELLTGEEPYADLHYGAIIGGIVSNTLRPPVPESCDPDWRSLMERCWAAEPSERPSFTEIVSELRAMAAKIPPKGQNTAQQAHAAAQSQAQK